MDNTMLTTLSFALLDAAPTTPGFSSSTITITALLDFAGLSIAIWTFWSSISFQPGGDLRRAFRLISLGSLAFALSHLLDTVLQLLDVDAAILIHQGAVLVSVLLFLAGLANLGDTLSSFSHTKAEYVPLLKFWPLAVGLTLIISAFSFILYGVGALAETAAFFALDGSLILLSGICLALLIRAGLGGPIGRSLWLAILGLLLFTLAHPIQVWFYEQTNYAPDLLGIIHRLIVIPALFLFAISITNAAHTLNQSAVA
jgi:hypothetical protein